MAEKLQKEEFTIRRDSKLLCVEYCDKQEVYMLSTMNSNNAASLSKKDRHVRRTIMKPPCITHYNIFMGTVYKTHTELG